MSVLTPSRGAEERADPAAHEDARTARTYMRADDRRAQILACARDVFGRRGFHVTSIADICKAAGIGRGTLYQYFGNKRAVFTAVLDDVARRVRDVLESRPPIGTFAPGEVAAVPARLVVSFCETRLQVLLHAVFADEATLRLLVREARGVDGVLQEAIRAIDATVLDALVADLSAARDMGVIDCPEPRMTALFVLGGVEKIVLDALAADEPIDLDRIVRVATRVELYGLLSDRTRSLEETPVQ